MDRVDWYFRQKVTEAELDGAFDDVENATWNLDIDLGLFGVAAGLVVAEATVPNLTVDITAGTAYEQLGKRTRVPTLQNLDVSVDSNSVSTAVSTPGNSKIVSVFVKFTRSLSDPRTDGNSNTVYFERDESFEFYVTQGAESATPSAPSLESDAVLLADITLTYGQTQIFDASIALDNRRQDMFKFSAGSLDVREGTPLEAVTAVLQHLNDHVTGVASEHAASVIDYSGGGAWHDGTTNPATDVESQLDKIITDLVAAAGADRVGAAAQSGSYRSLSAGSIHDQLLELLGWHNELASTTTSSGGSRDVGAEAQGTLNAVTATTLHAQLGQILGHIDDNETLTGHVLYVDQNGNAAIADGSAGRPYTTIAAALSAISSAGTGWWLIQLGSESYNETLTIPDQSNRHITIRGGGRHATQISGTIAVAGGSNTQYLRFEAIDVQATITMSGTQATAYKYWEFVDCDLTNQLVMNADSDFVGRIKVVVRGANPQSPEGFLTSFDGMAGTYANKVELYLTDMLVVDDITAGEVWFSGCVIAASQNITLPASGGFINMIATKCAGSNTLTATTSATIDVDGNSNYWLKANGTTAGGSWTKNIRHDGTA